MATNTKTRRTSSSAKRPKPTATTPSRSSTPSGTAKKSKSGAKPSTAPTKAASPNAPNAPTVPSKSGTNGIANAEIAQRLMARRRMLPFIQRFNPKYQAGWVHKDICRRLEKFSQEVAEGKSPRLMILMPPRHGKSEIASRNFPAWHMGQYPDHEFIACSYNVSLAMDFSRKVKQIISDPLYKSVFNAELDPNNQSTETWGLNNARGGYVAAGIGGAITGKGAHILLIDDPVKNAEEADSADTREKIWEWYLSTAYSRLAPGGGVLIIQTWWHDDDLAGRLQTMMKNGHDDVHVDQFDVVKYPAMAEADEWLDTTTNHIERLEHQDAPETAPLRVQARALTRAMAAGLDTTHLRFLRAKGEALHPARYDLEKLLRIKAQNKGGRWWSALYQQNPVPDDGAYFLKEHFRRAAIPHVAKTNVYIAWDFAISEKKQNDYTVGTVGLQDDCDVIHVADQTRFKSGDGLFIVESILNLCERWYSPNLILGFEDGQIYRAIEALLKKRMRERRVYPSIVVLKPITDKMARARPLQGRMQQGMVSFNAVGEWYDGMRQELLRFPAGVHDDQVDSLAWMVTMAIGRQPPMKPRTKEPASWKDKLRLTNLSGSHMAA
jgi:predicted phage terminase large subunit-like protein